MKKSIFNKMFLGLISGTLAPLILLLILYIFNYGGEYCIFDIIEQIKLLDLGAKIVALSVFLSNLILFFIMYRLKWNKFCRGILLATFLYAFLVVALKFSFL